MSGEAGSAHAVTVHRLTDAAQLGARLARDATTGLTARPKTIPPKYFYDARGSELFEAITELPEYYQTRTETALLERVGRELVDAVGPRQLVELGSGSSRKTRLLLEALHATGTGRRYVPFDVSEDALVAAASALLTDCPWLEVEGFVGDFERDIPHIGVEEPTLVAFLGSTIGNLLPVEAEALLTDVRSLLGGGGAFLIGFDLVKDVAVLEAAYNDAAGVTAEFNRNVLRVLNRELDGNLPVDAFEHVAVYDAGREWIEMRLRAVRPVTARLARVDLEVRFGAHEELRTEISRKFTRPGVERLLAAAGLRLRRWETDPDEWFAVALAVPA